jgi:hypothetical protein
MPRTGVFMRSLDAFGSAECPLTLASADQIEGPVATVDGPMPGTPWALRALLRSFDQRQINPLTNLPMDLHDIHPVLTPQMDSQAYVNGLTELTLRGWNGVSEVSDDRQALEAYRREEEEEPPKQRRMLNNGDGRAVNAEDTLPSLTDLLAHMRYVETCKTLWGYFNRVRETVGVGDARNFLDRGFCTEEFSNLKACADTRTQQYVAAFLMSRCFVWSHSHAGALPIWMTLDDLHADFMRLYAQMVSPIPPCEGRTRIIAMMLNWAGYCDSVIIADLYDSGADQSAIVIGMAPFLLGYLLGEAPIEHREWFRVPHSLMQIMDRIEEMEARTCRPHFKLALHLPHISQMASDFFKVADDEMPSQYVLKEEDDARIAFPRYANPTDPYTNADTLNQLRETLYEIEANKRTKTMDGVSE